MPDTEWRYLRRTRGFPRRPIKHAVLADAGPTGLALCGRGPWSGGTTDVWQKDAAGLAERRECGSCVKAVARRA